MKGDVERKDTLDRHLYKKNIDLYEYREDYEYLFVRLAHTIDLLINSRSLD